MSTEIKVINLKDLLNHILKNWIKLSLASFFTAVIFYFYASSLPNIYTSTSILKVDFSIDSQSRTSSSGAGLFSSIPVFGSSNDRDTLELVKRLSTFTFYEDLIKDNNLEVTLGAVSSVDTLTGTFFYDDNLYEIEKNKWVVRKNGNRAISKQGVYRRFYKNRLNINIEKDSGLVEISFSHPSPNFSSNFIYDIVDKLNLIVGDEKVAQTQSRIDYINEKLETSNKEQVKFFLNKMLEDEYKSLLLFAPENNKPLKFLDYPLVPEAPSSPKKIIYAMIGFFFGLFLYLTYLTYGLILSSNKHNSS